MSVRIPPIIFDNSTRSVIVSEGEGFKLECYAGGYPAPIVINLPIICSPYILNSTYSIMGWFQQVSWRRENYAVLPTGGSQYRGNILQIPSVSKDDRGTYYCVAENGVGKGKRRNIAVEVEFSPVITVPRYDSFRLWSIRSIWFDFVWFLNVDLDWVKLYNTTWILNATLLRIHHLLLLGGKTTFNSPTTSITGTFVKISPWN